MSTHRIEYRLQIERKPSPGRLVALFLLGAPCLLVAIGALGTLVRSTPQPVKAATHAPARSLSQEATVVAVAPAQPAVQVREVKSRDPFQAPTWYASSRRASSNSIVKARAVSASPGGDTAQAVVPESESATPLSYHRVQVGRFLIRADGELLKSELATLGYEPVIVIEEQDGRQEFRVQVDAYRVRENAVRTLEELQQRQFAPYLIEEESVPE